MTRPRKLLKKNHEVNFVEKFENFRKNGKRDTPFRQIFKKDALFLAHIENFRKS